MLRGNGVVCGTSTTGTGTLTLAATPVPPGGADFDVWARAAGFGNSDVLRVDYTIQEFTDSTFATPTKEEGGTGLLTLGSSSGIANCTLARTEVDYTITSLDSQPATYSFDPVSGISIGTAANTLVYIAPSANNLITAVPNAHPSATTFSRDGAGTITPMVTSAISTLSVTNQMIYYIPFLLLSRKPISKARIRIGSGGSYTGQNNNVYVGLYEIDESGVPGRLLADFGGLGTPNAAFASASTVIASAALSSPLVLPPGFYFSAVHPIWMAGGSGTPGISGSTSVGPLFSGAVLGSNVFAPINWLSVGSQSNTAFADPATAPTGGALSTSTSIVVAYGT